MNRIFRLAKIAAIAFAMLGTLFATPARSQGLTATIYQVAIDPAAHLKFGLYYPVTYMFQIPAGQANLTAQYRTSPDAAWVPLPTHSAGEIFNGVSAARFDYPNSTAYLSLAFAQSSDILLVRILSGETEVPLVFSGIPQYYDQRKAAVTVSLDDWGQATNNEFNTSATILSQNQIHFTAGIITGYNPDWSLIQSWLNTGYMEAASHSRYHPCNADGYLNAYASNIIGSRDDILAHLSLPYPYVTTYLEPCGYTSDIVRQTEINAGYLVTRGFEFTPPMNTFSAWETVGAYQRTLYSIDTFYNNAAAANASFDGAYAANGIYHLVDHPSSGGWYAGSTLANHAQYIGNRADVWYAAFGELYLYHFVQERGLVSVAPYDGSSATPQGVADILVRGILLVVLHQVPGQLILLAGHVLAVRFLIDLSEMVMRYGHGFLGRLGRVQGPRQHSLGVVHVPG